MIKNLKNIIDSSDLAENDKYYWGYMYELGYDYILPELIRLGVFQPGMSLCEIGSAEAGVLYPFMQAGGKNCLATDIAQFRLDTGKKISKILDIPIEYFFHNILEDDIPAEWQNAYDLVFLRDVIEHLENPALALTNMRKLLKPNGKIYITFPSYYSPYGGHQHTLSGNFVTKLPYLHFLPETIFFKLIKSGRPQDQEEVRHLSKVRLTTGKFEKAASVANLKVYRKDFYLLRPVFKSKFNLPTLKINALKFFPLLTNLFSTESAYILEKDGE